MKRFFCIVCLSVLFLSCNFQIPQSVSVKTEAEYSFSAGSFQESFSKYISVSSLKELIDRNSSTNENSVFNYKVYDYNPDGLSTRQQYLVEFALAEIPLDIGTYFDKLDFSTQLTDMSFFKEFEIPALDKTISNSIPLPDLNEKIISSATLSLGIPVIPIPEGINSNFSDINVTIDISSPQFTKMNFSSGVLKVHVTAINTPSADFASNVKVTLKHGTEEVGSGTAANIRTSGVVAIPLSGKALYKNMTLVVSGSSSGGSLPKIVNYRVAANFAEGAKIESIEGLTMSAAQIGSGIPINETVEIPANENFVSCKIGVGSVSIKASLPSGWTGVNCTPNIDVSGIITASEHDFIKNEIPPDILNRTLNLSGKTISAGNIVVSGSVAIELNNATINFASAYENISIESAFKVEKLESVTVDLKDSASNLQLNYSKDLPADIIAYIEEIKLKECGIVIDYENNFPADNDIQIDFTSAFFDINDNGLIQSGKKDSVKITSSNKTVKPADSSTLDIGAKIKLPGSTPLNPSYLTLKNVETKEKYSISMKITPMYGWEHVKLRTDGLNSIATDYDTGLNFNSIFSSLKNGGTSTDFLDKIEMKEFGMYMFCSKPVFKDNGTIDLLEKLSFSGDMEFRLKKNGVDTGATPLTILPANSDLAFKEQPDLNLSADDVVRLNFSKNKDKASAYVDCKSLLNDFRDKDGNITAVANIKLKGEDGSTIIKVTSDDIDAILSSSGTASIKIMAFLVLPLEFKVKDDISIDIFKLTNVAQSEDLFGRSEPTDIDDVEKYIDSIEYSVIVYKMNKNFIMTESNTTSPISVIFDTKVPHLKASQYKFGINSGDAKLYTEDLKEIFKQHPFKPVSYIEIPKGDIYIPRDAVMDVNLSLKIKTNGTIKLF